MGRRIAKLLCVPCSGGIERWRSQMTKGSTILTGLLGLGILATPSAGSQAAVYARPVSQVELSVTSVVAPAQYWRHGPRYIGPRFIGPRYLGPRYFGPRPGSVFVRPWVRRPYYGRFVAGVALGTIITVAAVGLILRYLPCFPDRPARHWQRQRRLGSGDGSRRGRKWRRRQPMPADAQVNTAGG